MKGVRTNTEQKLNCIFVYYVFGVWLVLFVNKPYCLVNRLDQNVVVFVKIVNVYFDPKTVLLLRLCAQ